MEMPGMEDVKGTVFIPMYDKEMGFFKKYLKTLYLLFFHPVRFFSKGIFDVKITKAAYFVFITWFIGLSLYFIVHEISVTTIALKFSEVLWFFLLAGLDALFLLLIYVVLSYVYYLGIVTVTWGKAEASFRKTFNICAYSTCFMLFLPIRTKTTPTGYATTKTILYFFPAAYRYLGFSKVYKIKAWRLIIMALVEIILFFVLLLASIIGQNEFLNSFGPRHNTRLIFEADMARSDIPVELTRETLKQISRVMEMRLERFGIHPKMNIDYAKSQLEVNYLGPKQAKEYLLDPGIVQWRIVLDASPDKDKLLEEPGKSEIFPGTSQQFWYLLSTEVELDNFDIKSARSSTDRFGSPSIAITLNKEGLEKLIRTTKDNLEKRMAVVDDGVVLSAPSIMEPLTTPYIVITGRFTRDETESLAGILRSSAYLIPIKLVKEAITSEKQ